MVECMYCIRIKTKLYVERDDVTKFCLKTAVERMGFEPIPFPPRPFSIFDIYILSLPRGSESCWGRRNTGTCIFMSMAEKEALPIESGCDLKKPE